MWNGSEINRPTGSLKPVPYSIGEAASLTERTQVRTVVNLSSYAELAVRLANTAVQAPGEPDSLGTPEACASALGDCLTGPVTRRDLVVLQHLRDEFAAIFTAAATGDDESAIARMNALLIQYPVQPELVNHDDQRWHVHLAAHGSVADQLAAGAIIGMALTVSLYGVNRLGVCTVASCHRVFIDASPGRSRRYCTEHMTAKGNVSTLRRQPTAESGQATPAAS
ncbi:MAG: CGNR zinc finger domain-containing protein [Streptosporangiaceae bacterium]